MQAFRSVKGIGLGLGVVAAALCAVVPGSAAAAKPSPMPHHHQMQALYVIDHRGKGPKSDAQLVAYSRSFQRVLAGCTINVDNLTNRALALAEQASEVGGREVTSLALLKAVARRIAWKAPRGCNEIFNLAEGHLEAGEP